jgi:hypothetical protein
MRVLAIARAAVEQPRPGFHGSRNLSEKKIDSETRQAAFAYGFILYEEGLRSGDKSF